MLGAFVSEGWARLPTLLLYVAVLLIALRSGGLSGTIARTVRVVLAVGTIVAVIASSPPRAPSARGSWPAGSRSWS